MERGDHCQHHLSVISTTAWQIKRLTIYGLTDLYLTRLSFYKSVIIFSFLSLLSFYNSVNHLMLSIFLFCLCFCLLFFVFSFFYFVCSHCCYFGNHYHHHQGPNSSLVVC